VLVATSVAFDSSQLGLSSLFESVYVNGLSQIRICNIAQLALGTILRFARIRLGGMSFVIHAIPFLVGRLSSGF
jgi:hypothetical protein